MSSKRMRERQRNFNGEFLSCSLINYRCAKHMGGGGIFADQFLSDHLGPSTAVERLGGLQTAVGGSSLPTVAEHSRALTGMDFNLQSTLLAFGGWGGP